MNKKSHPRDEWSDDVIFAEIEGYDRIQNKIQELERQKSESFKPLHKQRHGK